MCLAYWRWKSVVAANTVEGWSRRTAIVRYWVWRPENWCWHTPVSISHSYSNDRQTDKQTDRQTHLQEHTEPVHVATCILPHFDHAVVIQKLSNTPTKPTCTLLYMYMYIQYITYNIIIHTWMTLYQPSFISDEGTPCGDNNNYRVFFLINSTNNRIHSDMYAYTCSSITDWFTTCTGHTHKHTRVCINQSRIYLHVSIRHRRRHSGGSSHSPLISQTSGDGCRRIVAGRQLTHLPGCAATRSSQSCPCCC